ncbi:MAG: glycoside hydrolase family 32 protein [Oscillospiraceae bacterium]|nr:glycoside hydrolase family 32 protein [Oscillospiraceae bacterium]
MNALRKDLEKLVSLAEQSAPSAGPWELTFHLTPPAGWLNDPNGLCYFRGEYHVFYQYSPFNVNGGAKFWGHCKSRDLLHWERCPVMLCPDQPWDVHGAYSGSALCGEDGMYLFYTGNVKYDGEYDHIMTGRENNTALAFSPDGVHLAWKRLLMSHGDYPTGLSLHVRDPKVWEQDGRYYMVLGARTAESAGEVLVFASEDMLHWEHINTLKTPEPFGYMWECPDLFELDGQWFLLVSPQGVEQSGPGFENKYACGYFPLYGDFRGEYTLDEFVPLDYGFDFYAPQSFFDGKRRLLTGWMGMPDAEYGNPTAADGWQHCLTVLREVTSGDGRLRMLPASELEALRGEAREYSLAEQQDITLPRSAEILLGCEGELSLELSGLHLEAADGRLTLTVREGGCGRTVRTAPVAELRELRILADVSALEIFVNGGEAVLSTRWYPEQAERTLTAHGRGHMTVFSLRPLCVKAQEANG